MANKLYEEQSMMDIADAIVYRGGTTHLKVGQFDEIIRDLPNFKYTFSDYTKGLFKLNISKIDGSIFAEVQLDGASNTSIIIAQPNHSVIPDVISFFKWAKLPTNSDLTIDIPVKPIGSYVSLEQYGLVAIRIMSSAISVMWKQRSPIQYNNFHGANTIYV